MPQPNVYYALIRIRETDRPHTARRAHAQKLGRTRQTRPARTDPLGGPR